MKPTALTLGFENGGDSNFTDAVVTITLIRTVP